jgi:hypothetical protein
MELRFNGTFNGSIPGALISARTESFKQIRILKKQNRTKENPTQTLMHQSECATKRLLQNHCRQPKQMDVGGTHKITHKLLSVSVSVSGVLERSLLLAITVW